MNFKMAKFFGTIGYGETKETRPGIWEEQIIEREYFGDVLQNNRRLESGAYLNDNLNISNRISIVADPVAYENFHAMRYVTWMGTKWKVTNIEVLHPRMILTIGGVFNEQPGEIT